MPTEKREIKVKVEEFELEDFIIGGTRVFTLNVDPGLPADLRFNCSLERESKLLLLSLQAHLAACDKKEHSLTRPATWWDHFKLEYFPDCALRRWPAAVYVEKCTFQTTFPDVEFRKISNGRKVLHLVEKCTFQTTFPDDVVQSINKAR